MLFTVCHSHEWISEPECLTLRHAVQLRDILSDLETYSIRTTQSLRKLACKLVTGVLAVIVCEVCFKIRHYVSKLDNLSRSWKACLKVGRSAHWYPWQNTRELACNLVTGVLAVILCGVCVKIRQYVSKLDSLSQSWTICSLVFLTKNERACMHSCYGRLGSDLVWSMSQDQTVCLKVRQPVSKSNILAHWLSWQNMSQLACLKVRRSAHWYCWQKILSWEWSCVEYVSKLTKDWTQLY